MTRTGAASGPDAVAEACAEALATLDGPPGLLLALLSADVDPATACGQLADAAGGAPHAGLTGKATFNSNGPLPDGCVAVALDRTIGSRVGVAGDADGDGRAAGRRAAAEALEGIDVDREDAVLLLFLDSRSGDMADAIAGAYDVAGPTIPIAGGAAGGPRPHQLAAGGAHRDSVVAVSIVSQRPIGIGVGRRCRTRGLPSIVTRSEDRAVLEIDGRPAEEVYLEQLDLGPIELSDDEFEALAVTHPLSQPELNGSYRLRHVLGRAPDGGLRCATHIPASAAVEFTEMSTEELIESAGESVRLALDQIGGGPVRGALVFDCAGRHRILGDSQAEELAAIAAAFGDHTPPIAGIYTNGEVGRTRGAKGDHNHAIVTIVFG